MILVIAAHPDDETLGAGATIAKLSSKVPIHLLLLGKGRGNIPDKSIEYATDTLGFKEVYIEDLPDQEYDSVPLWDVTKKVEHYVFSKLPDTVYTHYRNDLNKDHRIVFQAVLTACRKGPVKTLYSFETLSSTEWQYPYTFSPNVWVDVGESIHAKTMAMQMYTTEIREGFHPRSIQGILTLARYRGLQVGVEFAEAFELVKEVV